MKNAPRSIGALRFALTAPDGRALVALSLAASIGLAGLDITHMLQGRGGMPWVEALFALAFAILCTLVHSGVQTYRRHYRSYLRAVATGYIRAGRTREEVLARKQLMDSEGPEGLLHTAGFDVPRSLPMFNADGTLSYADGRIDMQGMPVGIMGFATEIDTGLTLDTGNAYQTPYGMSSTLDSPL